MQSQSLKPVSNLFLNFADVKMTDRLSLVPTIRATKTIALNVSSLVEMSRIQNVRKILISENVEIQSELNIWRV